MKIIMPTGILYKNIQRQLKYSVRTPPNIGPKAIDETPIVAAIDNIKGISLGLKRMYILAIIMGIIAPPEIPCSPLKNVINKKLSETAQPILENIKPDKLIKKNVLVDNNLINQPLKGMIITSAINEADITYEICSILAFNSPCKYFKDEPTI